jgi:cytochrome c biogenesis protein CcmG/thiol:disulfide interchange protein DsbE
MMRALGPISGRLRSKTPHWSETWPAGDAAAGENSALVGNSTSRCGAGRRKLRLDRKSGSCQLAVAAMLAILLAGCAGPPMGSAPPAPVASPTEVVPTPESTADLADLKKAAGIADCPKSDRDVAAVPFGLPDVVLPCLGGGREVRLAGLRGKPMMINVWAQWCEPCRAEAPYLTEVARTNKSDLIILGIDHADPRPDLAIEFAQLSSWTYPQVADPDVVLRSALQITGPPQTFFIRPDGTIAYRHAGPFSSAKEIRDLAQQHLGVTP